MFNSSISSRGNKPQSSISHQPNYDINLSFYEVDEDNSNLSQVNGNLHNGIQQSNQPVLLGASTNTPRRSAQYREEFDTSFYQLPGSEDNMQSRSESFMQPVRTNSALSTANPASSVSSQPNNSNVSRPPPHQETVSSPHPVTVPRSGPATNTRPAPAPASAEFMLLLHQLCDVGFTAEHSTIALKRCNNNLEEAITFCLEHDDEAMQQYINEEIVAHDARLHALIGGGAAAGTVPSSSTTTTTTSARPATGTASAEPTKKSKNVFKRMIGMKGKHAAGSGPSVAASPNAFNMPVVAVEPTPVSQPTPAVTFSTPSRVQIPSAADAAASLLARSSVPPPATNPCYHREESEMDFSGLDEVGGAGEAVLNYSAMEDEVLLNSVLAESALEARQRSNTASSEARGGAAQGISITSSAGAAGGAALIRRMSPRSPAKKFDTPNSGSVDPCFFSSSSEVFPTPAVILQPSPAVVTAPVKPARPASMQKMNSTSSTTSTAALNSPVAPLTPVSTASTAISGAKYVEVTHEVAGKERWSVAVARAAEMALVEEEEDEEDESPSSERSPKRRPVSSVDDYGSLMDIQGILLQQQIARNGETSSVLDEMFVPSPSAVQSQSVFVFPEVTTATSSDITVKESVTIVPSAAVGGADELSEFGYAFHTSSPPALSFVPTRSAMLSAPSVHGLEISDSFEDLVSSSVVATTGPEPLTALTETFDSCTDTEAESPKQAVETETSLTASPAQVMDSVSSFFVLPAVEIPLVEGETLVEGDLLVEEDEDEEEEDVLCVDRGHQQSHYTLPTSEEVRDDERFVDEDRVHLLCNSSVYALETIPEGNTRRSRKNLLAGIDEVIDRNHGLGTKLGSSVLVLPSAATVSSSSSAVSSERDAVESSGSLKPHVSNKPPPPPGPKIGAVSVAVTSASVAASVASSAISAIEAPVYFETPVPLSIIRAISADEEDDEDDDELLSETLVVTAECGTVVTTGGYEGDADTLTAEAEVSLAMHGSSDDEEDEEIQDAVRRVNEQILRDEMLERTSMQTDSSHDSSNNLVASAAITDNSAFLASANTSDRSTIGVNENSSSSVAALSMATPTPRSTGATNTSSASPMRSNTPPVLTSLYHEIQTHLQTVHKRRHLACTVNEYNGKFTAQISLKQVKLAKNENSPQGNRSNSVIIGTCTTRELATDLCLTLAPPEWSGKHECPKCILCSVSFTMFKKGHHCRNCGFIVCVSCSNKAWPSSMLPTTYHDQEKYVRVCNSCQTGTELFVRGLRQGDYQSVLSLHASGNINLHCPISIYVNNAHPVHMAAAGGNLQLLQWLIEGKKCSVKDNATKRQLVTGKNLSVLAVAAQAGHVPIMRYLIHQRKCGVLEITEMSILHRALHVALESPGPMPPYIPPKGTKEDELLSEGGSVSASYAQANTDSSSNSSSSNAYDNAQNGSSTPVHRPSTSSTPNGVASEGYAQYQVGGTSTPSSAGNHSANVTPRTPVGAGGGGSAVPRPGAPRTQLVAPLGPINGPRAVQAQAAAAALAASTESIATPGTHLVAPLGPLNARGIATSTNNSNGIASGRVAVTAPTNIHPAAERPASNPRLPSYLSSSERQAIGAGASIPPVSATAHSAPASPSVHTNARNIVAPRALYNEAPVNIATAEAVTGYAYTTPVSTPNTRGNNQNPQNQNSSQVDPDAPVAATAFLTSDIIFEVSQHDHNFSSQSGGGDPHFLSPHDRPVSVRHIAVASPYVAAARGSDLPASPIQTGSANSFPELIVEGSAAPTGGRSGPRWW